MFQDLEVPQWSLNEPRAAYHRDNRTGKSTRAEDGAETMQVLRQLHTPPDNDGFGVHRTKFKKQDRYKALEVTCAGCSQRQTDKAALQKCSGCQVVRYCSKSCQKLHWKAGHAAQCRRVHDHKTPPGYSVSRTWLRQLKLEAQNAIAEKELARIALLTTPGPELRR